MEPLSEELLAVWLRLSGAVNNQRLVTGLSFHQAQVCGLLVQAREEGRTVTAKELCARTRILKSQMNAILRSLEQLGYLRRRTDPRDRRQAELLLLRRGWRPMRPPTAGPWSWWTGWWPPWDRTRSGP